MIEGFFIINNILNNKETNILSQIYFRTYLNKSSKSKNYNLLIIFFN